MRYIVILFCLISIGINAQTVTQPGFRDYQISGATLPDSILYIMGTDTLDGSAKQGLGKWHRADLLSSYFADTDWLKLGSSTLIPTNSDSAYRSGYTLFTGLDGGLPTKIEMLKEGIIRFDKTGLYNTPAYMFSMNPMQSGANVGRSGMVAYASDNTYGSKKNQVLAIGINPIDGDNAATGLYFSFEDYYRPSAPSAYSELHLLFNDSTDVDRRLWTWFINKSDPTAYQVAYYTDQFSIRDPRALTGDSTYFKIEQVDGVQSQLLLLGANNSVSGGSKGVGQLVHTTNNTFEIYPYGSMPSSSEFYTRQFNVTNVNRLRIENDFGTTNGSSGLATSIIGREGSYGGVVGIGNGWGWDLISGALVIDSSQVATQYDLTTAAGTNLSIAQSVGTQVIQSSTGTDVGVRNLYGLLITEGATDTLHFRVDSSKIATQYDISGFGTMSNWLLSASGTGGTSTVTNGATVSHTESAGLDITRSTNDIFYSLDLNEITTDNIPDGDEFLVGSDGSTINEKYPITKFDTSYTNEIQDITVTGASQPFTLDLGSDATDATFTGAGITTVTRSTNALTFTSTEVDGSTTNEAWTADADDATTPVVVSNQTLAFRGNRGIDTDLIDGAVDSISYELDFSELATVTTIETDDAFALWDAGGLEEKITYANLITDIISDVGASGDGNGIYDGSGTVPTATVATLTDNLTFSATAGEADLYIDGTNDNIGIGTNSPEEQLTISNEDSNLSYPIMAFHTDQTGSGTSQIGRTNYLYGAEALVSISAAKQTSTTSNDAVLNIDMLNSGGTTAEALDFRIKDTYTVNKPRLSLFGGMQNSRVDSVGTSITLDESYYAVRCTTSTIIITLPNANTTNSEWIGTQYWIYNDSGGNVTINPNGTNDTVNGSNADITLADNAGYYLMLMSTTAGAVNNWMGLKTP